MILSKLKMELDRLKWQLDDNLEWYSKSGEVSKHEHNAWGWREAVDYIQKEIARYEEQERSKDNG
jgi:hypothetical protein